MSAEQNSMDPMADAGKQTKRHLQTDTPAQGDLSLPLMPRPNVRRSTMSRRRAIVLVTVHLLMIGHVIQWLVTGRTLSPVEPSEAMYAINKGYLNAGAVFFAASLLLTLLLGRFVCGWACHLVAYQDFSAWLLKKIGIRPKPLRSRFLYYAPLLLALYMFVWPTAQRMWVGQEKPVLTNHLLTTDFWATFPGVGVAILTVVMCGFGIVYFLGSKGFCTYACPYGGFFAVVDRLAPGRIVVDESCDHSGHCTTACTSNVRVHEEVARFGMVVDPGCMKCMDCVSVCPNDALHFRFAPPAVTARASSAGKTRTYDFTLPEEIALAVVATAALFVFRGLYGQIPLLLAMGLAGMTAFALMKFVRLVRAPNVRLQQYSLKRGGRWTKPGVVFGGLTVVLLAFVCHSGVVQYNVFRGDRLAQSLSLGDEVWLSGVSWLDSNPAGPQREAVTRATAYLERVERLGLWHTPAVLNDLVWLYLATDRNEEAEATVRKLIDLTPNRAEVHRGLAGVLRKMNRVDEAEQSYRAALALDPGYTKARSELCAMLIHAGRPESALHEYDEGLQTTPDDVLLMTDRARLLSQLARYDEACAVWKRVTEVTPKSGGAFAELGMAQLRAGHEAAATDALTRAVELEPNNAEAQYNLALLLLQSHRTAEAVVRLEAAIAASPEFAQAHYHLAVALFMLGKPAEALAPIQEAIRLDPDDADANGFLEVVRKELNRNKPTP